MTATNGALEASIPSMQALDYDDDCVSIGVVWRREYDATGNASGNTFRLRFVIRTLGR